MALLLALVLGGVEVAPGTPCASQPAFGERLNSVGVALGPGDSVRLAPAAPDGVWVRAVVRGVALERRVPAPPGDCEAVSRLLVALVQAWASSTPRLAERAGSTQRIPGDAAASDAGALASSGGGGSSRGQGAPLDGGALAEAVKPESERAGPGASRQGGSASAGVVADAWADTGASAQDAGGVSSMVARAGGGEATRGGDVTRAGGGEATRDGGVAVAGGGDTTRGGGVTPASGGEGVTGLGARASPPGSVEAGWRVGVGLLGGVASGATSQLLASGQLVADVVRGWLGVAVDVGLSSATSDAREEGRASSSWQWASLSARVAVPVRERLLLEVQVGVRGYRVVASATGFAQVDPEQQLWAVGAVGSVGASLRLVGPFGLTLRLSGNTRRSETFFVANLGPVLQTGPLEGSALLGIVARF